MQWRIQTRKGGGLKYTPFIFNLELSSMAGEKIKGGSGGAPMEFPGAGGSSPPAPLLDPPLVTRACPKQDQLSIPIRGQRSGHDNAFCWNYFSFVKFPFLLELNGFVQI